MSSIELPKPLSFEWDSGNQSKNLMKHQISQDEAEQTFVNDNFFWEDQKHSNQESRYNLLGITNQEKVLFISFAMRRDQIRVISARKADKKERELYEKSKEI